MTVIEDDASERLIRNPLRDAMDLNGAGDGLRLADFAGFLSRLEAPFIVGIRIVQDQGAMKRGMPLAPLADNPVFTFRRGTIAVMPLRSDSA